MLRPLCYTSGSDEQVSLCSIAATRVSGLRLLTRWLEQPVWTQGVAF